LDIEKQKSRNNKINYYSGKKIRWHEASAGLKVFRQIRDRCRIKIGAGTL